MVPEHQLPFFPNDLSRRKFISTAVKAAGAGMLHVITAAKFSGRLFNWSDKNITVGEIMDRFIIEVPGAPFENTVDTLKAGNRDIVVTGIVTTMFATLEVIHKTIALGANFIIAHEPTFYNHRDDTTWLESDKVYRHKAGLLKKHGIAVWRNHDYIHRHVPDGVQTGVIAKLGWEKLCVPSGNIITITLYYVKVVDTACKRKIINLYGQVYWRSCTAL